MMKTPQGISATIFLCPTLLPHIGSLAISNAAIRATPLVMDGATLSAIASPTQSIIARFAAVSEMGLWLTGYSPSRTRVECDSHGSSCSGEVRWCVRLNRSIRHPPDVMLRRVTLAPGSGCGSLQIVVRSAGPSLSRRAPDRHRLSRSMGSPRRCLGCAASPFSAVPPLPSSSLGR